MTNDKTANLQSANSEPENPKIKLIWERIFFFLYVHTVGLYGMYLFFTAVAWKTWLWMYLLLLLTVHGVAVGGHRLWAHRTFKAKLPLRIFLAFNHTLAFQKDLYQWVRNHRMHHKYSDTEYDPHNASNGFFYSHMGWLLMRKPEKIFKKMKILDLSDLKADPVVMFQRKYYWYVSPFVAFVIPALVPWYFWNEPFWTSWHVCSMFRFGLALNATCLVNSAAHLWGNKPYDRYIRPVENKFVAAVSFGEGFHNYHHTFPWDYKAAEFGTYLENWNATFIELMAKIGWAYDLKYASRDMIEKRMKRTGDGTRRKEFKEKSVWGWGDEDMAEEDIKMTTITYQEASTTC